MEEILQIIQQLTSNYGNSNRHFQNRNSNFVQQAEKSEFPQGANGINQIGKGSITESSNVLHQPQQQLQQQGSQRQIPNLSNSQQNQASRIATPLPEGASRCVQKQGL